MAVIWGIPYLLIKVAVGELTPPSLVFLRTGGGALLLLPLAAARGDLRALVPRWRAVVLYTVVEIGIPWLLLSEAELRLTSSAAGLLVATVPLIGAILAQATGASDRMGLREFGGLLVGLTGVAALVGLDFSRGDALAYGEMVVVTVCYAVGPMIIVRRLQGVPTLGVVAASLTLTALAYAPAGILQLPAALPSARVIAAVATLAVLCTAVAFLVFFALIAEAGPIRATLITYVNPAVALSLGVLLLHEPLTVGAAAGLVLIVLGSFLSTRRRPAPGSARRVEPATERDARTPSAAAP